jgi:3-oxoacyl-[acyl-carrier protein] reductase
MQGANVTIVARDAATLDVARSALQSSGAAGFVQSFQSDIAEEIEVARLFADLHQSPPIDGLIHAAGVIGPIGRFLDVPTDQWLAAVKTNLFGAFLTIRYAAQSMTRTGGGRIVALSGGGASYPFPMYTSYAASKVALVRFIETVAVELEPLDIQINALAPGFVATSMHQETLRAGPAAAGSEYYERTKRELSVGGSSPEIAANAAVFLLSTRAAGITGKLVAAQWDDYAHWPDHLAELTDTDLFTLRRVLPKERGLAWQ